MRIKFKSKCDKCPLHIGATNVCICGDGASDLKGEGILFVGEAPGEVEDYKGRCFVGPTSKILKRMVRQTIGDRIPIRFTNAVRCYPCDNHPTLGVGACRDYLLEEIEETSPGRIIALGSVAIQALTGYRLPVTQVVEGWNYVMGVPTQFSYHPSAHLHNKSLRPFFVKSLTRMLNKAPPKNWRSMKDVEIVHVSTVKKALAVLTEAMGQPYVAYDTEYNDRTNRLLCASFCWDVNKAYVFDDLVMGHSSVIVALERLFKTVRMVAHNWKFDAWVSIRALGVDPQVILHPDRWWIDTSTLRKLYHPEQDSNLEIAEWMVGLGGGKEELFNLLGRSHKGPAYEKAYIDYPDVVIRYNGLDAIGCYRLLVHYSKRLKQEGLSPLWTDIFGPLGALLFSMEYNGLKVDLEAMSALDDRLKSSMNRELIAIRSSKVVKRVTANWELDVSAEEFNPKSTPQMRELLFLNRAGLRLKPRTKTPKGEPSADKHTIKAYKDEDPIMSHISEFNRLKHKHSTYVTGYGKRIADDQCIHCSIRQDAARTQRVQARDPNLMTIPNRGWEEDKAIRRMFISYDPDTEYIMEVDFSQVELRESADLSNDKNMMGVFLSGRDIHRKTASEMLGCSEDEVEKLDRTKAKPVNFGTIFGQSAPGLKDYAERDYGVIISEAEAEAWIRGFFRTYKGYRSWMLREQAMTRKRGCAYIYREGKPFARRWLFEIGSNDRGKANHAARQAINCVDSETEALTERGWVKGFDLLPDDRILTKNSDTGELEWQHMTDLKLYDNYYGDVIEFKSRNFHAVTTPEHRWLIKNKNTGRDECKTSETLQTYGDHRIHRTGNYRGLGCQLTDDELRIIGYVYTDGFVNSDNNGVGIIQSYEANYEKCCIIEEVLHRVGSRYNVNDTSRGQRVWTFHYSLAKLVRNVLLEKRLTYSLIFSLDSWQASVLLEAILLGDCSSENSHNRITVSDSSPQQSDILQALVTLSGKHATITPRDFRKYGPRYSPKVQPDGIVAIKCSYVVNILSRKFVQVQREHKVIRKSLGESFWCPMVPNTYFVARRSGHVYITGNTPIQGGASLKLLDSGNILNRMLHKGDLPGVSKIILPVHDALWFAVKKKLVNVAFQKIARVMIAQPTIRVPLEVEGKAGPNLADMKVIGVVSALDQEKQKSMKLYVRKR